MKLSEVQKAELKITFNRLEAKGAFVQTVQGEEGFELVKRKTIELSEQEWIDLFDTIEARLPDIHEGSDSIGTDLRSRLEGIIKTAQQLEKLLSGLERQNIAVFEDFSYFFRLKNASNWVAKDEQRRALKKLHLQNIQKSPIDVIKNLESSAHNCHTRNFTTLTADKFPKRKKPHKYQHIVDEIKMIWQAFFRCGWRQNERKFYQFCSLILNVDLEALLKAKRRQKTNEK
ncbi:hypothetical protein I6M44_15710 [Shewanella algae]|uniref:hypothetical protein n=1 Tax=Shewanella algae TaxID=38313 RepID=UPI001AAC7F40|nr:hypothetical protein [Shewanella algae]MBO2625496.1 hypothetical protein [Shewanella algae]BCV37551.1 hypothetical protein TUM17377_28790 [Shewanella chilikensis]